MSVINVLMQLRKVCNHPNLFEPRPIVSPFQMDSIVYHTASPVYGLLDYNPFEVCVSTFDIAVLQIFMLTSYSDDLARQSAHIESDASRFGVQYDGLHSSQDPQVPSAR